MKDNLSGQRFGRLTALQEITRPGNRQRFWLCRCDCGEEREVKESHLKSGHTKSCGCIRRQRMENRRRDLTGQRFGRLLVLEPEAGTPVNGSGDYWRCRCDCGKEVVCAKENLTGGSTQSCGCLRDETRKNNMKKSIHFVEGTCVERIASPRPGVKNTSGCRGVYRRENNRWRAVIGFQGKVHSLGSFREFEEAVKARKRAEEELYGPLLEKYVKQEDSDH